MVNVHRASTKRGSIAFGLLNGQCEACFPSPAESHSANVIVQWRGMEEHSAV